MLAGTMHIPAAGLQAETAAVLANVGALQLPNQDTACLPTCIMVPPVASMGSVMSTRSSSENLSGSLFR